MSESLQNDLGVITRACWAKAVPPASWEQLVRNAATAIPPTELEEQTSDALLQLLVESPSIPSPLVLSYLEHAITSSAASSTTSTPPLVRPGYIAARLSRSSASSAALHRSFVLINKALSSSTSNDPTFAASKPDELIDALEWAATRISQLQSAPPSATLLRSPTFVYIAKLLERPPIHVTSNEALPARIDACLAKLDAAVAALQVVPVGLSEASLSTELQTRLLDTRKALSAGSSGTVASAKAPRPSISAPRPKVSLDDELVVRADPDVAFLISDLLYRAHSIVGISNTPFARARIVALLQDRIAQAPRRGSTPVQALSRVFVEILLAATVDLRERVGKLTRHSSFAYSRLPELLREISTKGKIALDSAPEGFQAALESALRSFAHVTRSEDVDGMEVDDSNVSTSQNVLDLLVTALCQQELVSIDLGASLSPSLYQEHLVPQYFPSTTSQLSSGSIDSVREVFASLESHSPSSHRSISDSLVEAISSLSSSVDIEGLSSICAALVESPSVLSIVFLHVPACSILSPIRSLLDSFGSSLENLGDDDPSTGYGSILLFLEIALSRHSLHSDLTRHLGSTQGFIVHWLPSISATYPLSSLDDDSRSTINGWINALFGDGISDELMHQTNPRVLLRVVPTVAKQSLAACQAGVIDLEQLRDGLSFLLQGLLSFTLPGVLKWLIGEIGRTPPGNAQTTMLDILSVFIFSDSLPKTILELVASDLDALMLKFSTSAPPSPTIDAKEVEKLIKPYRRRTSTSTPNDGPPVSSLAKSKEKFDPSFDPSVYSEPMPSLLYKLLSEPTSSLDDELRLIRLAKTTLLVPSGSGEFNRFANFVLQDLALLPIGRNKAEKIGRWIGEALSSLRILEGESIGEGQGRSGLTDLLVGRVIKDVKRRRKMVRGDGVDEVEVFVRALEEGCEEVEKASEVE